MDNPGYGPLCVELKQAYRQLAEISVALDSSHEEARRADMTLQLEGVRERIRWCEGRLLVVSMGQKAPCDLNAGCSSSS